MFLLFTTLIFNSFACSNDNLNKDGSTNPMPSLPLEEEIEPTIIKLTKYNFSSYLNIYISQTSQTQTLISNTYYVKYRLPNGRYEFRNYTGMMPPTTKDVMQCSYLYSKYSVSTTFTINCLSKNKNYIFTNCNFGIQYRPSSSQISVVVVYVSQDGNGNNVFMMSEELYSPNKNYSLNAQNMIYDFNGEVTFFDKN